MQSLLQAGLQQLCEAVTHCPSLQHLDLSYTKMSDACVRTLAANAPSRSRSAKPWTRMWYASSLTSSRNSSSTRSSSSSSLVDRVGGGSGDSSGGGCLAADGLQELRLAGNVGLTTEAAAHLARAMTAGAAAPAGAACAAVACSSSLGSLRVLSLANCPALGDAGEADCAVDTYQQQVYF